MKRIFTNLSCLFFAATLLVGCKQDDLEEFKPLPSEPTSVSAGSGIGTISKNNERITIPLEVTLTSPASKAFQVGVQLNADTVEQLIEDGALQDALALPSDAITLPNVVQVPFGASKATFEISISITALERFYGENVAFAFNLVQPGKGNRIGTQGSNLITLNTTDLLAENEIHYVSFTNGAGEVLEARNRQNYMVTSGGLSIPLGITLASVPGRTFNVRTAVNTDTIATLVANGTLPENTIALQPDQYDLDRIYQVPSNASSAPLDVIVPWAVIQANMDKVLALSISLDSTSRHVLNYEKNNVIILIHPPLVVEVDVTNEGVFAVNRDNGGGPDAGEGSKKLIDNNSNTKFLQPSFSGDLQMTLTFETPQNIGAYTFTSANDADTRDPKDWFLEGSMDGVTWVTIDERKDEKFSTRFQTRRFEISQPVAYTHYRLNITNNNGSSLYQQAEWRMIRVP
jgi:hypothetical protein